VHCGTTAVTAGSNQQFLQSVGLLNVQSTNLKVRNWKSRSEKNTGLESSGPNYL